MTIVWRITERCNLSCKFCGYDRALARARREANPGQVRDFGGVLGEYQRVSGEPVLVSWLGGEPLLWPPLWALSAAFHDGFGLSVSATTNGTALASPAVRAHLLEHYAELTISVDGLDGTHDALRGWPDGFAALRQHVSALSEEKHQYGLGPRLRANVVLMRQTLEQFEPLCQELAAWGIEEVSFNQLGGNERPEFYPAHRLLPEQADRLAAELPVWRAHLAERGVRLVGEPGYLRRIQASARNERLPIADCHPGESFLFVDELGRIAPCSFSSGVYGVPMQEVASVQDLRRLRARFADHRRRVRLAACDDCHSTQVFEKFGAANNHGARRPSA